MAINYQKQSWTDGSGATPLSAARLGHIESGIKAASDVVDALPQIVDGKISAKIDPIEELTTEGRLSPEAIAMSALGASQESLQAQQGLKLARKSVVAFTPEGWKRAGRGVAALGVLASATNYRSARALSLCPQWTQSCTVNAMSGGAVGLVDASSGASGRLPNGLAEFQVNAKKTVIETGNGVIAWRGENIWSGTWGGWYDSPDVYTTAQVVGFTGAILEVPANVQVQLIVAWRNVSTGAITNAVGQPGATGGGAVSPVVSSMPETRVSVELVAPSAPSNLIFLTTPVTGDDTTGVKPVTVIKNLSITALSEIGGRPEQIPLYVPAATYPASDAVVSLPNGDYALIAVTEDRTFIPLSVSVTGGSLSLATAIGGVGRYSYLYIVQASDYSPKDLSSFLPTSMYSGLATPAGATHSRGIMHLSALNMGKRSSAFVSGVNGGSNDRAVQLSTGGRHARFEVHQGERDPDDGPGQNRSELSYWRIYPHGQAFGWAGWINVESLTYEGPSSPEKYCLLMQWRYAATDSPDPGASPEVALEILGSPEPGMYRMRLLTRSGVAVSSPTPPTVTQFDITNEYGWIYVGVSGSVSPTGGGSINAWVNRTGARGGQQQVAAASNIPIGYTNSSGFRVRNGAYANNWNTPRIVEEESIEFGLGLDVLSRVSAPPPRLVS